MEPKKKNNKLKVIILVAVAVLLCICILIIILSQNWAKTPEGQSAMATSSMEKTLTKTYMPSNTIEPTVIPTETLIPTITDTPVPTNTPVYFQPGKEYFTPVPDLYATLLKNKKEMTELQFKDFLISSIGQRLHMKAKVYQVEEDKIHMSPFEGGFFDAAYLYGVPRDILVTINKGAIIEFDATILEMDDFIITMVNLGDPVIYSIIQ